MLAGCASATPEKAPTLRALRAHLAAVDWIQENPANSRQLPAARLSLASGVADQMALPRFAAEGRNDPGQIAATAAFPPGPAGAPAVRPETLFDEGLLSEVLRER